MKRFLFNLALILAICLLAFTGHELLNQRLDYQSLMEKYV